jgi:FkbM family methyltransferase
MTIRTKQGLLTVFCADGVIAEALYRNREYEVELMMKVRDFLHKRNKILGGTVLDIGANMGVSSIGMIHNRVMERAIAVEPDPHNFSLLQHNVRQNGLEDRVICLPIAASDSRSEVQFELSDKNFGDHRVRSETKAHTPELLQESSRNVIEVEADCVDNLLERIPKNFTDDIGLIWIDTQGHEGKVFLGGKRIFSRDIPVVSEIWPYGIERSGMSDEEFCNVAEGFWSSYWVIRRGRFFQYPISSLHLFFDELGHDGGFENVIFTK